MLWGCCVEWWMGIFFSVKTDFCVAYILLCEPPCLLWIKCQVHLLLMHCMWDVLKKLFLTNWMEWMCKRIVNWYKYLVCVIYYKYFLFMKQEKDPGMVPPHMRPGEWFSDLKSWLIITLVGSCYVVQKSHDPQLTISMVANLICIYRQHWVTTCSKE